MTTQRKMNKRANYREIVPFIICFVKPVTPCIKIKGKIEKKRVFVFQSK